MIHNEGGLFKRANMQLNTLVLYYSSMCSAYWNLEAIVTCPQCHKRKTWTLQTHFMGDFGSCVNHYTLGEPVEELADMNVRLDGMQEGFIGNCPKCGASFDFGANIIGGKVEQVFPVHSERVAPLP